MKKYEIHLRITQSEYDALCGFAFDGEMSLNAAVRHLIKKLQATKDGTVLSQPTCNSAETTR